MMENQCLIAPHRVPDIGQLWSPKTIGLLNSMEGIYNVVVELLGGAVSLMMEFQPL